MPHLFDCRCRPNLLTHLSGQRKWARVAFLLRQYLYFCTSKASKLSSKLTCGEGSGRAANMRSRRYRTEKQNKENMFLFPNF